MAGTPLHFGDSDRILYGVYHEAEKRAARAPAVLLFNPFGEEAIRAYRTFKVLSDRLARNGISVLRFDYFGTGDSGGEDLDVTFSGMIEDAIHAQDELEALSGARNFVWIGLGLGGAVALDAALKLRLSLAQVFLWDAVLRGSNYLETLHHTHAEFLSYAQDEPIEAIRRSLPKEPSALREALGFEISETFSEELSSLDVSKATPNVKEYYLLQSGDSTIGDEFIAAQDGLGIPVHWFNEMQGSWNSNEALNSFYVPAASLDHIVKSVK